MIRWDNEEHVYMMSPINGAVSFEIQGAAMLKPRDTVIFDNNKLNITKLGEDLQLQFEDGVLAGSTYKYTPKDKFITIGRLCDSTIRLDYLKSRQQFKIEY